MSYLDLLNSGTLFHGLFAIDRELASRTRSGGCPRCGNALHAAYYERKPRGECRGAQPPECRVRLGLCCGTCRRRVLPPSVLYLGRRVYWGSVVLLVTAAAQGLQRCTINELCERFGVTRRTVKRWVQFFLVSFPRSDAWRRLRGHVSASVANDVLPRSFLEWLLGGRESAEGALSDALKLIACGP